MRGVSHILGWQDYTVAYGNKCNTGAFQVLGSSYLQENPCAETHPCQLSIDVMTEV